MMRAIGNLFVDVDARNPTAGTLEFRSYLLRSFGFRCAVPVLGHSWQQSANPSYFLEHNGKSGVFVKFSAEIDLSTLFFIYIVGKNFKYFVFNLLARRASLPPRAYSYPFYFPKHNG
jgi:hypothetical protein